MLSFPGFTDRCHLHVKLEGWPKERENNGSKSGSREQPATEDDKRPDRMGTRLSNHRCRINYPLNRYLLDFLTILRGISPIRD
jgi:hypothetical protein